jgi:type IV pilus secretin PilQ/predicted competence protein
MKTALRILIIAALAVATTLAANPLQSDDKLTLSLDNVPLPKVLKMIADQNKLNLVMSDKVEGLVSLQMDNVDLKTALNAILTANGYVYFLQDNVIVVKSLDNATPGEMDSRVVVLKYLDPITAKKALDSRRSAKGQIIILDQQAEQSDQKSTYKANRILITDYPAMVDDLVALVHKMDVPERIVLIEAKLVETTLDKRSKLGFAWPTYVGTRLTGVSDGTSVANSGTSTTTNTSAGALNIESGRWTWGTLSVDQLQTVLDLLNQDGRSKLISDPRITTVENHEAEIMIATVIPIQTINRFSEGAAIQDVVTFQDEDVGISLKVTPRINEDGKITLDVEPKVEDIIGYNGPPGNQKPIKASRSVRTRITVADGETAALGGLLKEDEIVSTQRLPVLGHIPFLGGLLFSNKAKEKTSTDLMILITPHILP